MDLRDAYAQLRFATAGQAIIVKNTFIWDVVDVDDRDSQGCVSARRCCSADGRLENLQSLGDVDWAFSGAASCGASRERLHPAGNLSNSAASLGQSQTAAALIRHQGRSAGRKERQKTRKAHDQLIKEFDVQLGKVVELHPWVESFVLDEYTMNTVWRMWLNEGKSKSWSQILATLRCLH